MWLLQWLYLLLPEWVRLQHQKSHIEGVSQAVIRGTTIPAPKAIMADDKEYLTKLSLDSLWASFTAGFDSLVFVFFGLGDSLTFSRISVETRLSPATAIYSNEWLVLFEKPIISKIITPGIAKLPIP